MTHYRLPINGYPNRMRSPILCGGDIADPFFNNVSLLMHFNGTNGSTNFIDQIGNTVTRIGGTTISTTQFKYGGAAGFFDGSGDYLTIPISTNLHLLSGDFTIECWFYSLALTGIRAIISQWQQGLGTGGFLLATSGSNLLFFFGAIDETNSILSTSGITTNTWNHLAVTRFGNLFTLWVNGNSVSNTSSSATRSQLGVNLSLGNYYNNVGVLGASGATDLNAYVDDLRITKNIARYTTNFTPPTSQFPDI